MLCEAAYRLGITPIVLAERAADSAAQLCPSAVFGSTQDPAALHTLFTQVPAVIFENEFVARPVLEQAARNTAVRFLPGLDAVEFVQDKSRQKLLLQRLGIATSPFRIFEGTAGDIGEWVNEEFSAGSIPPVFKWSTLGYDGKGTWLGDARAEAVAFCRQAVRQKKGVYREARVDFRRELAIVAVRSTRGEFTTYPLVISQQKGGICRLVTGPARALGVSERLEQEAQTAARRIAEDLDLVGCFALEFFETQKGELWVNELAPRVHNSGHYTQNASSTSQFENHLRAVLGLPLGATTCTGAFAMLNLLGPESVHAQWEAEPQNLPLPIPHAAQHLHWYAKGRASPGRKLGHLNCVVAEVSALPQAVRELEEVVAAWHAQLSTGALS